MLVGAAFHHVNVRAMRFRMGVLKRRDGDVCRSASDGWMVWFRSGVWQHRDQPCVYTVINYPRVILQYWLQAFLYYYMIALSL